MLTVKEQLRLKRYEEDLAMPKWKYIVSAGLSFGVVAFVLTTASNYFFDKNNFHWDFRLLLSAVITIPMGGFLFGWMMRKFIKWEYKKLKAKTS